MRRWTHQAIFYSVLNGCQSVVFPGTLKPWDDLRWIVDDCRDHRPLISVISTYKLLNCSSNFCVQNTVSLQFVFIPVDDSELHRKQVTLQMLRNISRIRNVSAVLNTNARNYRGILHPCSTNLSRYKISITYGLMILDVFYNSWYRSISIHIDQHVHGTDKKM
jgi:hypothetical protein